VTEVEYVNANGELRTVDREDSELLRAAAGALGLLGVVTAYTVKLDRMTYTSMRPQRVPVELAIPQPQEYIDAALTGDKRYEWINELISGYDKNMLDKARAEFIKEAEGSYYAEWVSFSLQDDVCVNTWDNNGDESQAVDSPSDFEALLEWLEEWLVEVITSWTLWKLIPGEVQAKLLGFLTLALFPNLSANDPPSLFTLSYLRLHCSRHAIGQRTAIPPRHPKLPYLRCGMESSHTCPSNAAPSNLSTGLDDNTKSLVGLSLANARPPLRCQDSR